MTAANDLHAAITAKLDAIEKTAQWYNDNARFTGPAFLSRDLRYWMAHNSPATVLRGLAEDRDILARHRPLVPSYASYRTYCYAEGTTDWPCPEVLSLARRLGVEVAS